ncbi:MAG: hypothetical protein VX589_05020 [Myxococcota bacterium]|nr:hypothetical protein [Myxococcota bacterium]
MLETAATRFCFDEIETSSRQVAVASVVLASSVAWADGIVQPKEKVVLRAMFNREHEADPKFPLESALEWLKRPPPEEVVAHAFSILTHSERPAEHVEQARAVAEAHGGIFGVGAISSEEKHALHWMSASLNLDDEAGEPPRSSAGWRARIDTLRTVIDQRTQSDIQGRWNAPIGEGPVKCPQFPGRMPPTVTDISDDEYEQYRAHILRRYMRALVGETWSALEVAVQPPVPLDDTTLANIYWRSPFSRFLTARVHEGDSRQVAEALTSKDDDAPMYAVDHTYLEHQKPFDGVFVAPTIGYFRAVQDGLVPVEISVAGRRFSPKDGESWERARLFLLQGSSLALVGGVHASLHFPMDAVVAITRSMLAPSHPVSRVIEAHAYLQLPLNYGVRWSPRSYAHNSPREIYTAFPGPREDIFAGFMTYYEGIENHPAYPAYRYPMSAPTVVGPYGELLRAYYRVILAFCERVASVSDPSSLGPWAEALNALIPGFPGACKIGKASTIARVLAGFVHSVSAWHYLEHTLYSQLPVHHNPHRLRVAPPTGAEQPTEWWQRTRRTDLFRQEIARRMFYEGHTVRRILDVEYGFDEPDLDTAAIAFKQALRDTDNALPEPYQLLENMACSIQF